MARLQRSSLETPARKDGAAGRVLGQGWRPTSVAGVDRPLPELSGLVRPLGPFLDTLSVMAAVLAEPGFGTNSCPRAVVA